MQKTIERPDPWVTLLTLFVTVLGVLAIWDAGYSRAAASGQLFPREMISQTVFGVVAMIAGTVCSRVDRKAWRRLVPWLAGLGLLLMLLVEVPGLGKEINFARRWVAVGSLTIQPSEFIKLSAIFLLSAFLIQLPALNLSVPSAWPRKLDTVVNFVLVKLSPIWIILVSLVLLERQKDLGTAAVVVSSALAILVVSKVNFKIVIAIVCCLAIGGVILSSKEGYRANRIANHIHRWDKSNRDNLGYQTTQSEIALARGGLLGVGFGNGRAKHNLPAPTTDFVLATVAEEFGLVGAGICIAILAFLSLRLVLVGLRLKDQFSRYVNVGIGAWIAFQTVVNVAMVNGTLPPIGVPLPFITCGGSSLIALWIAVGICQSLQTVRSEVQEEVDEDNRDRWRNGRTRLSGA
jgi:cell division protein FtsW